MAGSINTKVCLRLKLEDEREIDGYTKIYQNERWIYYFNLGMWNKFIEHINLLDIEIKPTNKTLYSQCLSIIPKYGKYTAMLVFLLGEDLSGLYSIDEILALIIQDENYFFRVLDDLNSQVKSDSRYEQICIDVQGYEKEINDLKAKLEDRNKKLSVLANQYKKLEIEKNSLQDEVDVLKAECQPIKTRKWVEPKSMPVMKAYADLHKQFATDTKITKRLVIANKIYININKDMSEENVEYLKNYYNIILEFVAVKLPHLITYIRYFSQLQKLQRRKPKNDD